MGDSEDAQSLSANSMIHIDSKGDVELVFGPKSTGFLVDSKALRRSSKVFARLLCGCDELKYGMMDMGDVSNFQDLKLIFDAAHANFGAIPKVLSLPQLDDVAALAAKFEMLQVLQPWAEGWTSKWALAKLHSRVPEKVIVRADILRISALYHFGSPESFAQNLVDVMLNTTTDSDGDLTFSSSEQQDGQDGRTGPHDVKWNESGVFLPDALLGEVAKT